MRGKGVRIVNSRGVGLYPKPIREFTLRRVPFIGWNHWESPSPEVLVKRWTCRSLFSDSLQCILDRRSILRSSWEKRQMEYSCLILPGVAGV